MKQSRRVRRQLWRLIPDAKSLAKLLGRHGFKTRHCYSMQDLLKLVADHFKIEATNCAMAIYGITTLPPEQIPVPPGKSKPWRAKDFDADHVEIVGGKAVVPFYESEEWRKVRYQALKLHGALCQCCGAKPGPNRPLHVDHIKPRSKFPELELDITNLQVLCKDCNFGKSAWDQTDWRQR